MRAIGARLATLPKGTAESDIKAKYTNGILEVRAPVKDPTRKRSSIPMEKG